MIKFRAWDKVEKEWLSIRTIGFDDDGSLWYLQAWDENENDIDPPYLEDDLGVKWELIQSTGLKDKNGVEIYEGDVVKNNYDEIGRIRWFKGSFDFCDTEGEAFYLFSMGAAQPFEILGNIYEHPYLLEE
ncbi:YopX family protein [Staphylococcus saprophyticus]|nr:YopX family protein [Staphylococcus saprophyticus]